MYALRPKIVIECPHLMNHPASIVIIGQIDKKKNKILASYRAHGGFPLEGGDIHSAMPIGGAMPSRGCCYLMAIKIKFFLKPTIGPLHAGAANAPPGLVALAVGAVG